ncbi:hypothetical protein [Janthinobacterium agaricidamnosum]|nr:hypothetical protein [Janthinobacterium agaricidamnosum]
MQAATVTGMRGALLLAVCLPALGGCTAIAVTSTVVGAGVSVASTAVDATVLVGKGVVKAGSAVAGSGN